MHRLEYARHTGSRTVVDHKTRHPPHLCRRVPTLQRLVRFPEVQILLRGGTRLHYLGRDVAHEGVRNSASNERNPKDLCTGSYGRPACWKGGLQLSFSAPPALKSACMHVYLHMVYEGNK